MRNLTPLLLLSLLLLANGRQPTQPIGHPSDIPAGNDNGDAGTAVAPPPIPEQPDSVRGLGQLWAGVSQWDTGHCDGYGMPSGSGSPPALSWPVDSQDMNEGRPFSITHSGIDIRAEVGSPVYASATGRVIWAGYSTYGLGNVVAVRHGGGWHTLYGHLSAAAVTCGQWVYRGDVVGSVGMSGGSNYEHLHFEIRNGAWAYRPF
jgi:murein DD-endopeptidase MepM/ murein hydrolase activator NlpD